MAISRTARILLAILLLTAAAFFWVNFFTQNALVEEGPTSAPIATVPAAPGDGETGDGETAAAMPAGDATAAAIAGDTPTAVAGDTPPVVVIDGPVTLSRDVVVADLPFLITEPRPAADTTIDADERGTDVERRLGAARATVNPFSPVVVRVAAAPERQVPTETPVITEVAVPVAPAAIAGPRVTAPAPEVRAPATTAVRDLPRALPSGMPLSATPDLLRQSRTPVERVDVTTVAAIRLPEAETATPAGISPPRVTTVVEAAVPEVLRPTDAAPGTAVVRGPAPGAPLAAGTNTLSRYLRDNGYTFTGSALGPVSVGVFRSNATPTPVVVAIGQSLPETDIVLTDLRGQQAQLTLGDTTQILVLDLRR